MVNLDSFGFTYPQVMDNASTTPMAKLAETNSIEMGLKYIHASIVNADADSSSFRARKIPAITFHGLNGDWARYLHSSNDKAENINANSVIIGYQYTLNFIAKVDKLGCGDLRNDPKPEKKH
jgi:hypothetical protein